MLLHDMVVQRKAGMDSRKPKLTPGSLVTVQEVLDLLTATFNEEPNVAPVSDARSEVESESPYATTAVGGMAWCVGAVRALQSAGLLAPVSYDKLITEFEGNRYRWEFVQGYTVIV